MKEKQMKAFFTNVYWLDSDICIRYIRVSYSAPLTAYGHEMHTGNFLYQDYVVNL